MFPEDPTEDLPPAWLLLMMVGPIMVEALYRHYLRAKECQAIEQATYDKEFWELVDERAPDA